MSFVRRSLTVVGAVTGVIVLGATAALAHVTVSSPDGKVGGYGTVVINVPSESDTASTVGLQLQLPAFAQVSVQPKPGWTFVVKTAKLATPLTDDDGNKITDVTSEIDWTATAGGIPPQDFDTFSISVGPFTAKDVFKAIQTYSDGTVVSWVQQASGGVEPDHPAPTLTFTTTPTTTATPASNKGLAMTGVILGAVAVLMSLTTLVISRRRHE